MKVTSDYVIIKIILYFLCFDSAREVYCHYRSRD